MPVFDRHIPKILARRMSQAGHIGQHAVSFVFEFHPSRTPRPGRLGGRDAFAGLQAGLLVGADHVIIRSQRLALVEALVEVQDHCGLGLELGVTRENPTPVGHGLIASALSHRQTVAPLMAATIPRCTASRVMSAWLKREKGRSLSAGNSQASALTCTSTSGGKKPGTTPAWAAFQARQSVVAETLPPFTDDLTRQV